jgi:Family of unknown function (DUF5722)
VEFDINLDAANHEYEIALPTKKLGQLRLDLGSGNGTTRLSALALHDSQGAVVKQWQFPTKANTTDISKLPTMATMPAPDATAFPNPPNVKGLQVQMVDDAVELGINHAGVNVSLGAMVDTEARPSSIRFNWEGRDWFINSRYIANMDKDVQQLSRANVLVYLILLAYPTRDPKSDIDLVHPAARRDGRYTIAAFNTATPSGIAQYRALVAFLAHRYSGAHGRVWGWIIGNEVNSQWLWYNLGKLPLAEVVRHYEKAVRTAHEVISTASSHARCYLSFDHHWNTSMPGISDQESYRGKDFLDTFARVAKEHGDYPWHLAHHPYPDNLGNPRTWLDKAAWTTEDSPHITFKNLEVACRYMHRPELLWQGKPRRIILSEQGLHCLATPDGDLLQAAGFAYVWEKIRRQDGIDALIWHRHVDHAHEGGLKLGLWENEPGSVVTPGRKRRIHQLFKQAGTPEWPAAIDFALPIVGLKSWDELK